MKIVKKLDELNKILEPVKNTKKSIGLVLTMGNIHQGHLSLVDKARSDNDFVVVAEMPSFDDFAAIKLVVEGSGAVKNLTMLEAIDFTKATSKASKIGYKAPGQ